MNILRVPQILAICSALVVLVGCAITPEFSSVTDNPAFCEHVPDAYIAELNRAIDETTVLDEDSLAEVGNALFHDMTTYVPEMRILREVRDRDVSLNACISRSINQYLATADAVFDSIFLPLLHSVNASEAAIENGDYESASKALQELDTKLELYRTLFDEDTPESRLVVPPELQQLAVAHVALVESFAASGMYLEMSDGFAGPVGIYPVGKTKRKPDTRGKHALASIFGKDGIRESIDLYTVEDTALPGKDGVTVGNTAFMVIQKNNAGKELDVFNRAVAVHESAHLLENRRYPLFWADSVDLEALRALFQPVPKISKSHVSEFLALSTEVQLGVEGLVYWLMRLSSARSVADQAHFNNNNYALGDQFLLREFGRLTRNHSDEKVRNLTRELRRTGKPVTVAADNNNSTRKTRPVVNIFRALSRDSKENDELLLALKKTMADKAKQVMAYLDSKMLQSQRQGG